MLSEKYNLWNTASKRKLADSVIMEKQRFKGLCSLSYKVGLG